MGRARDPTAERGAWCASGTPSPMTSAPDTISAVRLYVPLDALVRQLRES